MMNYFEIILEKYKNNFFAKNHSEIQVHTILICALYLIKYSSLNETEILQKTFEKNYTLTVVYK